MAGRRPARTQRRPRPPGRQSTGSTYMRQRHPRYDEPRRSGSGSSRAWPSRSPARHRLRPRARRRESAGADQPERIARDGQANSPVGCRSREAGEHVDEATSRSSPPASGQPATTCPSLPDSIARRACRFRRRARVAANHATKRPHSSGSANCPASTSSSGRRHGTSLSSTAARSRPRAR